MISKLYRKIKSLLEGKSEEKKPLGGKKTMVKARAPSSLWKEATTELAIKLYKDGEHKKLALILPHLRDEDSPFIKKLLEGRLLTLGKAFDESCDEDYLEAITVGADPEFILEDENGNVALFSAEQSQYSIVMSQATLGADYGLMEFRPPYAKSPKLLLEQLDLLHKHFALSFTKLKIKEVEAVVFDHKIARIRSQMEDEHVDFGVEILKEYTHESAISLEDESSYFDVSLSAYDEPLFKPPRTDLLSAGGHIHIGGTFVKILSLPQIKEYIRRIDALVLPLCTSVETAAAALRTEVYGAPGEFRIKPYGLEYRTPSNAIFWPKNKGVLLKILNIMVDEAKEFLLIQKQNEVGIL